MILNQKKKTKKKKQRERGQWREKRESIILKTIYFKYDDVYVFDEFLLYFLSRSIRKRFFAIVIIGISIMKIKKRMKKKKKRIVEKREII